MSVAHPVIVVGGGISGIACARALHEAGVAVRVLDRGRRPGGRMASRRMRDRPVDTGASYFTVSDPAFEAVVTGWRERGLARAWTDTFVSITDSGREAKSGPVRWGATQGLRSLVEDLADGLDLASDVTVARVARRGELEVDGTPASAVVLAMPDPQARRLLDDSLASERGILNHDFEPVLALTATFERRTWDFDGAFLNDDPVLDWVADDGRRRGDDAPVLVAHSSSAFAADHLADPDRAVEPMAEALRRTLGVPQPQELHVHRWSFARPTAERDEPYLLSAHNVGACGDGWARKPRVEAAYLSGRALGRALVHRLRSTDDTS